VLAFAYKEMPRGTTRISHADVANGLIFLGLQAMLDPPRPEAARAIEACQRAGVKIKMITGDHAVTAASIGRQLGLAGIDGPDGSARLLAGKELQEISDQQLISRVDDTVVFARVSPEHKLRLVSALQERGQVVAMTGDGVNDAPALRRADIGIAMAISGTEVAREAADMVLTDDNFASIEAAVEEGRAVYDTLEKFIVWTLPTNGGQGFSLLAAVLLSLPLPLQPVQLLWVNMTTAVLLGLTLAFEPPESGLMQRPPRDPKSPIVSVLLLWRIVFVSLVLAVGTLGIYEFEVTRGAAQQVGWTAATTLIVVAQIFYLINCRSLKKSVFSLGFFSNPWLWAGVGGMLLLQLGFIYLPWPNYVLHSAPLPFDTWLMILGFGVLVFALVIVESALVQRWKGKKAN
jgi:Ca2+-transporting ATPase